MSLLLFSSLLTLFVVIFSQKDDCIWYSNGNKLNLNDLKNLTLISSNNPNSPNGWLYPYTPCMNSILTCDSVSNVMAIEQATNTICVAWLAVFDHSITPVFSASNMSWIFTYTNGPPLSSCENDMITFKVIYYCNSSAYPYDKLRVTKPNSCTWIYHIESSLAC